MRKFEENKANVYNVTSFSMRHVVCDCIFYDHLLISKDICIEEKVENLVLSSFAKFF